MTTYKIANKDARYYVERQLYFKGSNLFSEERNGNYVVFSYGYHWPLIMFNRELATWFVNSSKRSVSTSRQLSQARPNEYTNREGFKVNKFDDMLIVHSTTEEMTRLMNQ